MQTRRTQTVIKLMMAVLLLAMPAYATVHVSEVMADNDNTLLDIRRRFFGLDRAV